MPSWLADWWLSSAYLSRREPIAGKVAYEETLEESLAQIVVYSLFSDLRM